ncbi:uncharacterized zinc finger protein CG2678-like [Drosophila innubila]|uniref:uncharacterized zinc finger protein CG2678-like n=1 Tax=Drosophila innubila TaxID=198719 RepID=UPI00148E3967|nr:uncharacterized zinc finger protein CG2678-like [Drosophila innubila]
MEAVCRICMDNSVALVDIFEEGPSIDEKPSLADMLNECAGCKVKQDDPLPKQICDTCVLDCLNAFRFKRTCQQSQERFMEILNEKKEKKKEAKVKCEMQNGSKEDWQLSDNSLDLDCVKIENPDEEILPDVKLEPPHSEMKIIAATSWQGKIIPIDNPSPLTGKIYCCKLCGKEFFHLDKLAKHRLLHDHELRPYKCPYCPVVQSSVHIARRPSPANYKPRNTSSPTRVYICTSVRSATRNSRVWPDTGDTFVMV